jgi:hypothetical protein
MRLGLSSTALPGAAAEDLLDACVRRGLGVLELTLAEALLERERMRRGVGALRGHAVGLAGVLAERCDDVLELAGLSRDLGAPVLLAGPGPAGSRLDCARQVDASGGTALVVVSGPTSTWSAALGIPGVRLAWQVDAYCADAAADADALLEAGVLDYVRIVGGGPEAALQEGLGIGAAMKRLALAGYSGPVVVAPSSPRYRVAWATWLGRRGGWGCGSATAREPLPLTTMKVGARA